MITNILQTNLITCTFVFGDLVDLLFCSLCGLDWCGKCWVRFLDEFVPSRDIDECALLDESCSNVVLAYGAEDGCVGVCQALANNVRSKCEMGIELYERLIKSLAVL